MRAIEVPPKSPAQPMPAGVCRPCTTATELRTMLNYVDALTWLLDWAPAGVLPARAPMLGTRKRKKG
jgi:hypothetical protein